MLFSLAPLSAQEFNRLSNPSFEEDADNVGYPDGWKLGKEAKVTLNRDDVPHGTRALVMEKGYAVLYQNLEVEELAGRRVTFRGLAQSPDGAKLGVRIGCFVTGETGEKEWRDFPLVWNRIIGPRYETITAERLLPEEAIGGRFWFCLYRSGEEGTLFLDDLRLEVEGEAGKLNSKEIVIVRRELGYLTRWLEEARRRHPDAPLTPLKDQLRTMEIEMGRDDFSTTQAKVQTWREQLLHLLYPNQRFLAHWSEAFERLEAGALPLEKGLNTQRLLLPGEHAAWGIELANPSKEKQKLRLKADLLKGATLRRQLLMETWYTRGATLVADPLVLIPQDAEAWEVELHPGEIARFYLEWQVPSKSGEHRGEVIISEGENSSSLPLSITIATSPLPPLSRVAHYQFLYSDRNVADEEMAAMARDLEAHGVSDIEWPYMPTTRFDAEGNVLEVDWSRHDRWLSGMAASNLRLNLFWAGGYKALDIGGKPTSAHTEVGRRALAQLLEAYLQRAETLGLKRERFTLLLEDEIHSKHLDESPDERIVNYTKLATLISEKFPLKNYLTIGNYSFPSDIKEVLPFLQVAMPHWPLPVELKRNAPPGYNPRAAYFSTLLPMLEQARRERGLEIWSYHVFAGKSADVLKEARAYPLLAVHAGLTGFGAWAYNVSSDSTWDDTDGKILDYCLIYDGREAHPLNLQHNVTRELIVPSILWRGLRAGQQDAVVLRELRERGPQQPPAWRERFQQLEKEITRLAGEDGYGSDALNHAAYNRAAASLRELFEELSR